MMMIIFIVKINIIKISIISIIIMIVVVVVVIIIVCVCVLNHDCIFPVICDIFVTYILHEFIVVVEVFILWFVLILHVLYVMYEMSFQFPNGMNTVYCILYYYYYYYY